MFYLWYTYIYFALFVTGFELYLMNRQVKILRKAEVRHCRVKRIFIYEPLTKRSSKEAQSQHRFLDLYKQALIRISLHMLIFRYLGREEALQYQFPDGIKRESTDCKNVSS